MEIPQGNALQSVEHTTSRDRSWDGFEARLYDVSGGVTETPVFLKHNVTMLVGKPVRSICRCYGSISRRLQVPGEIDIVPAGYSGAWEHGGRATFVDVNVSVSLVRAAAQAMGLNPDRAEITPHLRLRDPHIEHICWALKAELETLEPLGRLYANSLGLALAAQLLRRCTTVAPRRMTNSLSQRRVRRVVEYINEHLAQDLTLAELAQTAQLSPSHFKVLFKQSSGVPVHQYVIRRRVEYAIELLSRGNLRLSEVAFQAGFADQSHMARCMRRLTGATPDTLRKQSKGMRHPTIP